MAEKYEVLWAKSAKRDLRDIIEYIRSENPLLAKAKLEDINTSASNLYFLPLRGRVVPELMDQGILQYRELIISPWRMIYRVSNSTVYVPSIIDSRQNVEDILLNRLVRE